MAVPVEPYLFTLLIDYSTHEFHYLARAIGSGVADRITDADRAGATANRRGVERANRFGIGARSVFGDEHHRQAFVHREGYGFLRHLQEFVERPAFSIEADRRRTDK